MNSIIVVMNLLVKQFHQFDPRILLLDILINDISN